MKLIGIIAAGFVLAMAAGASEVWAAVAAEESNFRQWWDLAWRILNFLILAFLIVKVAKKPLTDFLSGQRKAVAAEIQELEEAKAKAQADLDAWEAKSAGLAGEMAEYEKLLAATAQNEREALLADAKNESDLIMERAHIWADQSLRKARRQLADELLEMAEQIAVDKMQSAITPEDRSRLLDTFNQDIKKTQAA